MSIGLRPQVKTLPIAITGAGDNVVIAAVAGKLITVVGMILVNGAATANSVTVKDGTVNLLSGPMPLGIAPSPPFIFSDNGSENFDWYQTTSGANSFILNLSAATPVGGTVWYIQN